MNLLQAQETGRPAQSRGIESVVARLPVTIEESASALRIRDASIEIAPGETPKYKFTLLNSAGEAVTTYEVKWTLFNENEESVTFTSTSESALPVGIIEPGALYTPPGGGSCMFFKGFQISRAVAELTYYELWDGTVYDSQKTKFGVSRKQKRAEWSDFYNRIRVATTGKSGAEAEQIVRREVAAELARKPRTNAAMAADAIQASLDGSGFDNTFALIRRTLENSAK